MLCGLRFPRCRLAFPHSGRQPEASSSAPTRASAPTQSPPPPCSPLAEAASLAQQMAAARWRRPASPPPRRAAPRQMAAALRGAGSRPRLHRPEASPSISPRCFMKKKAVRDLAPSAVANGTCLAQKVLHLPLTSRKGKMKNAGFIFGKSPQQRFTQGHAPKWWEQKAP